MKLFSPLPSVFRHFTRMACYDAAGARAPKRPLIDYDSALGVPWELTMENEPLDLTALIDNFGNIIEIYMWSSHKGFRLEPVYVLKRATLLYHCKIFTNKTLKDTILDQDARLYDLVWLAGEKMRDKVIEVEVCLEKAPLEKPIISPAKKEEKKEEM